MKIFTGCNSAKAPVPQTVLLFQNYVVRVCLMRTVSNIQVMF